VVLVLLVVGTAMAAGPLTVGLRQQLRIQERLLEEAVDELQRHESRVEATWVRVQREAADLLRAQDQGEDLESLKLRDADLRQAEAELMMNLGEAQRLRRLLITTQLTIDEIEEQVRQLEGRADSGEDPLSGTWRMILEPGGQEGYLNLQLEGTLVQGTYQLSGDWSGSVRGTLVARKVRLERIDSQIGFAAIFHANLVLAGRQPRLEGTWEATQLASGLPSRGTWIAERLDEIPED
jgi:hypothetical protein